MKNYWAFCSSCLSSADGWGSEKNISWERWKSSNQVAKRVVPMGIYNTSSPTCVFLSHRRPAPSIYDDNGLSCWWWWWGAKRCPGNYPRTQFLHHSCHPRSLPHHLILILRSIFCLSRHYLSHFLARVNLALRYYHLFVPTYLGAT